MRISTTWLHEWVPNKLTQQQLCDQLTMAGLEVDAVEEYTPQFSGVIAVKIESLQALDEQYTLVTLHDGKHSKKAVTLSSYPLKPKQIVAFAPLGAKTAEGEVKAKNIAGIDVEGMLCAKQTLGLEEQSDKHWQLPIDTKLGVDIAAFLPQDTIIEIDLTPNRGDCSSIRGVAREVAAKNSLTSTPPENVTIKQDSQQSIDVSLSATEACTQYIGRVVEGINPEAVTPLWMQNRLRHVGVRCIHPVVDITNYVMMELGQPMHAFDCRAIQGSIEVRYASKEKITLLDGSSHELSHDALVIADAKGPIALAGIMGGQDSGTNATSTDIFLESALFSAPVIAKTARKMGLSSDSAYRFERGVDSELQSRALNRATELILEICGGMAGPISGGKTQHHPNTTELTVSSEKINRIIGTDLSADDIAALLCRLEFVVEQSEGELKVQVPSFRPDITILEDISEEVARLYGYEAIQEQSLPSLTRAMPSEPQTLALRRIKALLTDNGFSEVISYSFIDPELHQRLQCVDALPLVNPISSDMAFMRTSLWPGLLQTQMHNARRQNNEIKIFEQGCVFLPGKSLQQVPMIGALISGEWSASWEGKRREVDFYDLKGVLERCWALTHRDQLTFEASQAPGCHPGQCADILFNNNKIGTIARLHPLVEKQSDIGKTYVFEIQTAVLQQMNQRTKSQLPSKFPQIRRDLAFMVNKELPVGHIKACIQALDQNICRKVDIFDIYQGKGVPEGQKSVALGLTLQHDERTLVDEEVDKFTQTVIQTLKDQFNAQLRD